MFDKSLWIWENRHPQNDEYADFLIEFQYKNGAVLNISADSNYAVYINEKLIAFSQYADFPHYKIYDSIDISRHCKEGRNSVRVTVWYYGISTTAVYCKGNAGLIYEITDKNGNILAYSSESTPSRQNPYFEGHREKIITPQLGYSFLYNLSGKETEYSKSTVLSQVLPLHKRPIKRLSLMPPVPGKLIKQQENRYLFDLGAEQVGFIFLECESAAEQLITVSYGEHITDGWVRRKIAMRDFSVEFYAKQGKNRGENHFRRLGCRYLEIESTFPLSDIRVGIMPTVYPLSENKPPRLSGIHKEIYDICVNTLKLCMHEHYEDCPWREQGLYTMDSRNQMLCGYYAFLEYEFPRACLKLISMDRQDDGLLSICYPKTEGKVIPSFSLHYVAEVLEYFRYSEDRSLLEEIFPKIQSVLKVFTDRLEKGLILPFESEDAWNFYEWQTKLDGKTTDLTKRDVVLNCLLSKALSEAAEIAEELGIETDYRQISEEINRAVNEVFFDSSRGVYIDIEGENSASELGNSLAVLCGAAEGKEKELCRKIQSKDSGLTPLSLSMLCFKYDAFLKVDREKYKTIILDETEKVFTPMVEFGNRTVWETEKGESDFGGAGSLCHGWSAMPVYYYNILED